MKTPNKTTPKLPIAAPALARAAAPPADGRVPAIEAYWLAYQTACQPGAAGFSASALGHSRRLADERAMLIAGGIKRAHASLLRDFEESLEALPQPGEHLVVLDGEGEPRAIVRNRHVERRYFNEIDDVFAREAGEGDLTLAWWLAAHRQDFAERGEAEGFEAHERLVLVLEHFDRVWPPDEATAPIVPGNTVPAA